MQFFGGQQIQCVNLDDLLYETFDEFYGKLSDIVNSSFCPGERIPETRVVRKSIEVSTLEV